MTDPYAFPDLPLEPVEAGTNLLVAGPAHSGVRRLVFRMLVAGSIEEGTLFITTDRSGASVLESFTEAGGSVNPDRLGVVDCSQQSGSGHAVVRTVGSPGDLTGIGIQFSSVYEHLYTCGARRVRTGVCTLSPLVMYNDDVRPVYRFLHTLTGRVRTADGLSVCAIDPDAVEETTLSSIQQAFDGRIDLRTDDSGPQLRARGLAEQSTDWQSLVEA